MKNKPINFEKKQFSMILRDLLKKMLKERPEERIGYEITLALFLKKPLLSIILNLFLSFVLDGGFSSGVRVRDDSEFQRISWQNGSQFLLIR